MTILHANILGQVGFWLKWRCNLSGLLSVIGVIAFLGFSLAQLAVGFAGIEDWAGSFWAWAALICAIPFRFTLPITIGAFFGAMNVLGWHWALALLFATPGLLFMVPGLLAAGFSLVKR